jgi:hypothetical protein
VDVYADGVEECDYNLITDDTCIELCESGECDNGNCVETEPVAECYEDYIASDCITSDCYSGKITRECDGGVFGEFYCKATIPNVFQCNTDEECVSGKCLKKTECEHGDVKYGHECVTTDCYTGTWKITCRSDGTWDTGECTNLDYRCNSKQECVDGECVDKKEDKDTSPTDSKDEFGRFLVIAFFIIFLLVVLGVGSYVWYSYYSSKPKPKEPIKPSFTPAHAPRRSVLRKPIEKSKGIGGYFARLYHRKPKPKEPIKPHFTPTYVPRRSIPRKSLEKAKVKAIIKKRRKAKRIKREKFLKPFSEENKKTIPKQTKK